MMSAPDCPSSQQQPQLWRRSTFIAAMLLKGRRAPTPGLLQPSAPGGARSAHIPRGPTWRRPLQTLAACDILRLPRKTSAEARVGWREHPTATPRRVSCGRRVQYSSTSTTLTTTTTPTNFSTIIFITEASEREDILFTYIFHPLDREETLLYPAGADIL